MLFSFGVYCVWHSLLALIYTLVLLYSILVCDMKKYKDTFAELSYHRDPREDNLYQGLSDD